MGKAPDLEDLKALPAHIRNPKAVLLDRQSRRLIYVFPAGERSGRIAVALDYSTTVATRKGQRGSARINSIRTVDLVPAEALRNTGRYEVLVGEV